MERLSSGVNSAAEGPSSHCTPATVKSRNGPLAWRALLPPVLLGIMFVLSGYRQIQPYASPGELLGAVGAVTTVIVLLYLLLFLGLRHAGKAGLLTLLLVFLVCFALEVKIQIDSALRGTSWAQWWRLRYILPPFALAIGFLLWRIWRTRSDLVRAIRFLNIALTLMLAVTVVQLVPSWKLQPELPPADWNDFPPLQLPAQPPDIYYILLDGHTSPESLRKYWEYDASEFVHFLEGNGFVVVSNALANYGSTSSCMASALNVNYPPPPSKAMAPYATHARLFRFIDEAVVPARLRTLGYEFSNLSPFRIADQPAFYRFALTEYATLRQVLINKSALGLLAARRELWQIRDKNMEIFSLLKELPAREAPAPRFIYAHLMMPHPPFFFDRHGNPTLKGEGKDDFVFAEDYLEQLIYTDQLVTNTVSAILATTKRPAIVILQGDHGFRLLRTEDRILEAGTILNAYHLPGGNGNGIPADITPVNTFRMIFNRYFGANLPMLPNVQHFGSAESAAR